MGVASIVPVYGVRAAEIDYDLARGATEKDEDRPQISSFKTLLTDRRLLALATAVILFHFGNAAMLPLVGQKLTEEGGGNGGPLFISAAIIVAQVVMVLPPYGRGACRFVGAQAVFLVGFINLAHTWAALHVKQQSRLSALRASAGRRWSRYLRGRVDHMVADLTKGTGRFNVTQGAIATSIGIGAALSNLLAEFIVGSAGYNAAFLTLAGIAGTALAEVFA